MYGCSILTYACKSTRTASRKIAKSLNALDWLYTAYTQIAKRKTVAPPAIAVMVMVDAMSQAALRLE